MSIQPPEIYAEWLDMLDLFEIGESDEEVLEAMAAGSFDLDGEVEANLISAIGDALAHRIDRTEERVLQEIDSDAAVDLELRLMNGVTMYRDTINKMMALLHLPMVAEDTRVEFRRAICTRAQSFDRSTADLLMQAGRQDMLEVLESNPFCTISL